MAKSFDEVIQAVIKQMEEGGERWQMPWHGRNPKPLNVQSGRSYRGFNLLVLWHEARAQAFRSRYWGTFNQWRARRQPVSAGSTGTPVFRPVYGRDPVTGQDDVTGFTYYVVFNGDQVLKRDERHPDLFGATAAMVASVDDFIERLSPRIKHGDDRAAYNHQSDLILMPDRQQFFATATSTATQNYYATLLHELVHWSGHQTRLKREYGTGRDSAKYAVEELIAELGAAFLCSEFDLEDVPRPDHAQYLKSWLERLNHEPRALATAAGKAQAAVEFLKGAAEQEPESDDSVPGWFQAIPRQIDLLAPDSMGFYPVFADG